MRQPLSRSRLFLIRLAVSAALLLLAFSLVRLLWYPGAFFTVSGLGTQLLVLALAVFLLGPALSAFVYRPGKKNLAFDLGVLAVLEISAVVAALAVFYLRQPTFAVFAVDRFEAVALREVDRDKLALSGIKGRAAHAPRLVYARMPTDPDVKSRLIDETLMQGLADIDRRPEFWRPYTEGIRNVRTAAVPLQNLLAAGDRRAANVARWLSRTNFDAAELAYLPLRGRAGDATLILHASIGYPVATLAVDPW